MRVPCVWSDSLERVPKDPLITLSPSEAHHLLRVLRRNVRDPVEVLNGLGLIGEALIEHADKDSCRIRVYQTRTVEPPRKLKVVGPPEKGKRLAYMLEKLQETGVASWQPLLCERSEREKINGEKLLERLRETCKQCRSPWLMRIEEPVTLSAAVKEDSVVVLDPDGCPAGKLNLSGDSVCLIYGPEGGFSTGEHRILEEAKVPRLKLSGNILRMETAAILGAGRMLEYLTEN